MDVRSDRNVSFECKLDPYSGVGIIVVAFVMLFSIFCIFDTSTQIEDLTTSWKTQPIVYIYAPQTFQGDICAEGYDVLNLSYNTITGVTAGACGCTQNLLSYQSSNETCYPMEESSSFCGSLGSLPAVPTVSWRETTFCVQRYGKPAAVYKNGYHGRPHPSKSGKCPKKYKRCGTGLTQAQGAICFPESVECPITNIRIVPSAQPLPATDGWEDAGELESGNYTLYFRRQHIDELPIVNIAAKLTEFTSHGQQVRGPCYSGDAQNFNAPLEATSQLWTYSAELPYTCDEPDPRWTSIDTVTLENHFLQNVQVSKPSCSEFELYSLSDPRYNASADPDYLHSGVPCGTAPLYSACARDPFQHTDCAAGDYICDGVVHQNICGEYARAVRSAFDGSRVAMGLFFAREIEWSDSCVVSKASIFRYRTWIEPIGEMIMCGFAIWMLFVWCTGPLAITMTAVAFGFTCKLYVIYEAMHGGECTDAFTAETLASRLHNVPTAFALSLTMVVLMIFVPVVAAVYRVLESPSATAPAPLLTVPEELELELDEPAPVPEHLAPALPTSSYPQQGHDRDASSVCLEDTDMATKRSAGEEDANTEVSDEESCGIHGKMGAEEV